jgi:hypothetical protein
LLVNEVLPEDMRDYNRTLDKKGLSKLLSEVAKRHPDKYREISHNLANIGRKAAYRTGGFSFGLKHLTRAKSAIKRREQLQTKLNAILDDDSLPDNKRETQVLKLVSDLMAVQADEIFDESKAEKNPLAYQLAGAGRGNKMNLASLRGSDGLYQDHRNNVIPIPVLRSYSQGLSPLEYWAGTYGARQGVMSVKFCLHEATEVLMADFTSKAIKDVVVGDTVFSLDEEQRMLPTRVRAVYSNGLRDCNEWLFQAGNSAEPVSVVATPEHKIYARRNMSNAAEMLSFAELGGSSFAIGCTSVLPSFKYAGCRKLGPVETFDIEVEHPSHRFVLANGLVVSNSTQDAGYLCLHEDTEVRKADGTAVSIKNIAVGDVVIGSDMCGNKSVTKVVNVFNNGPKHIWEFTFVRADNGELLHIAATQEHKVLAQLYTAYEQVPLSSACSFFCLILDNGTKANYVSKRYIGVAYTYDIEVDHPDHLFVLANGAIVSNSKQLNQIAHRSVVVSDDAETEPDTLIGLPVDTDDDDSEGALLAAPIGKYKRNTTLTPKILHDLREQGIKRILVRSPTVSGTPDGGVYARDVGVREFGRLPTRFENPGLAAAQALSEPISQSQLSAKHTGGVAGQSKGVSGFDRISSLVQIPKTMKDGAAHSTTDGTVQSIEPAPAGGVYVTINGTKHYVGVGFTPSVKKGDRVEAGDVISDGLPNPGLIVQYKGVGEGRRYFTQAFRQAIRDTGMNANRRNVELLARGLINHVRLTDEIGDFAPDDIVQYNTIAASYKPREGHRTLAPSAAVGSYLEKPYLHYTIGTVVKPSMLKDFQEFGVNEVVVHTDPPPFEPEMIRGMANLQHDPDWMTRMFGSGLKTSLLRGVHRGATSDESGTSFVPSRARAVDFGRIGVVRTPEKPKPGKPE